MGGLVAAARRGAGRRGVGGGCGGEGGGCRMAVLQPLREGAVEDVMGRRGGGDGRGEVYVLGEGVREKKGANEMGYAGSMFVRGRNGH